MSKVNETNENKSTWEFKVWNVCKSISLVIAACAVFCFVTGANPLMDKSAYADDTVQEETVEDNSSSIVISQYAENGTINVPYTSIYDININDRQLTAFLTVFDTKLGKLVCQELRNATPNEIILRCATYAPKHTERVLNEVLGVTLAGTWTIDENGDYINIYGDIQ